MASSPVCQYDRRRWNIVRLAVAALWLLASQADADNFTNTWDSSGSSFASPVDGSGEWSTSAADWSTGSADVAWPTPAPTAYTAVFGNGGAAGTVTITSPVVAAGLTFDSVASGNYTIASSGPSDTLTLSLPTTITVGSGLSQRSMPRSPAQAAWSWRAPTHRPL
jgi:hypothetical protein